MILHRCDIIFAQVRQVDGQARVVLMDCRLGRGAADRQLPATSIEEAALGADRIEPRLSLPAPLHAIHK